MSTIVSTIQEIIRQELRRVRVADLGIVEEVYPHTGSGDDDNYGCDVRLKNSGLLLKRVPLAIGHIGTAAIPNNVPSGESNRTSICPSGALAATRNVIAVMLVRFSG